MRKAADNFVPLNRFRRRFGLTVNLHCVVGFFVSAAFGILKKCAAKVNMEYGVMPADVGELQRVCAGAKGP
jgi:hypothetical protein